MSPKHTEQPPQNIKLHMDHLMGEFPLFFSPSLFHLMGQLQLGISLEGIHL